MWDLTQWPLVLMPADAAWGALQSAAMAVAVRVVAR